MTQDQPKDLKEKVLEEQTKSQKSSFFGTLRGYFLAGVVVTAPIFITLYLTWIFLTFIDSQVIKLIPEEYMPWYSDITVPGIGLIIALSFFILVGWFAKNFLGRLIIRISEYIVDRVPVIRTLYGAVKQIFETIMASQSQAFREVVMLEYPRKGVWAIGFVTGKTEGEVQTKTEADTVNVFLPTTPNPTSGFLLLVPKSELKYLDMSVEEGVKLVVSAGIIAPPEKSEKE